MSRCGSLVPRWVRFCAAALGVLFSATLPLSCAAQPARDPCAQYFAHDPSEPFLEGSVVNHDGFLQAEHFRASLLVMRDNPTLIPHYSEGLAKRLLDVEVRLRREVDSVNHYPPADPLFNRAHPAFALEYSSILKEQPALASGAALDVYLREDADWTFLQQLPGWSRTTPDAWVGTFLFPRALEVDRDTTYAARDAAPILEEQLRLAARRESSRLWYTLSIVPSDYSYDPTTRQLLIKPDLLAPAPTGPQKFSTPVSIYRLPDLGFGSGVADDSLRPPGGFRTLMPELDTWRSMVDFPVRVTTAAVDHQLHLPPLTLSPTAAKSARLDHPETMLRLRLFLDVQRVVPMGGSGTDFSFVARVEKVDLADEKGAVIASVAGRSLPAPAGPVGPSPHEWRPAAFDQRTKGLNCRNMQANVEQSQREAAAKAAERQAENKLREAKNTACNAQAARQADAVAVSPRPEWQAALKSAREACLVNGPSAEVVAVAKPATVPASPQSAPLVSGGGAAIAGRSDQASSMNRQKTNSESAQERTARMMQQAQDIQQREIDRLKLGIVRIDSQMDEKEVGTGFVLSSTPQSALIATALHVVKGARSITVTFLGDQNHPLPARKLPSHSDSLDIAVIQVTFPPSSPIPAGLPKYNFAANNTFHATAPVATVNYSWTIVPNTITKMNSEGDPQRFEYTNISVGPGFSGGPVFDAYHDIIGIHTSRDAERSFAVAVKMESALQVFEALGYTVPSAGPIVLPDYSAYMKESSDPKPADATPANKPPSPVPNNVPPRVCDSGCKATLRSLRAVAQYRTENAGRSCVEDVRQFPKGWPGDNLFMHLSICAARPGAAPMIAINFAGTGRQGDRDPHLGIANLMGSSGQGVMTDGQENHWRLLLQNPNFGGPFDLNAIEISVEPFGLHR